MHTTFTGGIFRRWFGAIFDSNKSIYCRSCQGVTLNCVTTVNGQLPTLWLPVDWTGSVMMSLDSNLPMVLWHTITKLLPMCITSHPMNVEPQWELRWRTTIYIEGDPMIWCHSCSIDILEYTQCQTRTRRSTLKLAELFRTSVEWDQTTRIGFK